MRRLFDRIPLPGWIRSKLGNFFDWWNSKRRQPPEKADDNPDEFPSKIPNDPKTTNANEAKTIDLDLPGSFPNGARIHIKGDRATIQIKGIDSLDDIVRIIVVARENGAKSGELFTNKVIDDHELEQYVRLANEGGTRFGGQVHQLTEDTFKIVFDSLPDWC